MESGPQGSERDRSGRSTHPTGEDRRLVGGAEHRLSPKPARRDRVCSAIEAGCCWLAESEGQVLGYKVIDTTFYGLPFAWLLIVARSFRRRGVGTALLRHAESLYTGRKLFTSTNESNHPSQRLMESFGFERSGRIDNLDDVDPEIIYVKRLNST